MACLSSQSPPVLVFLPHLQVLEKRKVRLTTAGISQALCWELEKAPQAGAPPNLLLDISYPSQSFCISVNTLSSHETASQKCSRALSRASTALRSLTQSEITETREQSCGLSKPAQWACSARLALHEGTQ